MNNHLNAGLNTGLRWPRQFPPPSWWLAILRDWVFAILATVLFFAALEIISENERHIQVTDKAGMKWKMLK